MIGLNNSQIGGMIERLAVVAVGYAVGAGYVAADDAQTFTALIVAVVSAGIAIWNNRKKRLAERAASAGMTVLAPTKIADNTKSSAIISSDQNMIVPKKPD